MISYNLFFSSCSSCPSSLSNSTMVSYNSSGLRGMEVAKTIQKNLSKICCFVQNTFSYRARFARICTALTTTTSLAVSKTSPFKTDSRILSTASALPSIGSDIYCEFPQICPVLKSTLKVLSQPKNLFDINIVTQTCLTDF